ncbi:MAG: Fic family protein, partial [Candidatus Aenigmarchaeota archaeon]|nr:Fic family protein [Candidatus Aenigmarchaeota archaeon]
MAYTEIQKKGDNKYYYRVKSFRERGMVRKKRKYLGPNLPDNLLLKLAREADKELDASLNTLLSAEQSKKLELIKNRHEALPKGTWQNRYERFLARFTYDSNAIEGNTLSLQETSAVIFDNVTPKGKSPREISEAINHKKAFDYMLKYKDEVNKKFICELQKILVTNTLRSDLENQIGKYRTLQVYIRGAGFTPPNPSDVPKEMRRLLLWLARNKDKLHPLITAAYFHAGFEAIHPFVDGNGRTGRLIINFMLSRNGYPMANIPHSERIDYYT